MRLTSAYVRLMGLALGLGVLFSSCAPTLTDTVSPPSPHVTTTAQEFEIDPVTATAVTGPKPFQFAVIGDFGTGSSAQHEVAERMCRWRKTHPFKLVVTTGDNIYDVGSASRFQDAFFDPYSCLLDDGVRFKATLGNHDIGTDNGAPELNEPAFGIESRNYIVRRSGVRFVMVDSNRLRWGWLDEHLKPRSGDRWTIVVFHHPVYSAGEHGQTPGFRPWLPRLFREHGVDLVLTGHDHNYEVTKKLNGIRYVVSGGGGADVRPCRNEWFTDKCRSRHHFLYVRVGREQIKVRAIPRAGKPFDVFRTRGIG